MSLTEAVPVMARGRPICALPALMGVVWTTYATAVVYVSTLVGALSDL